MNPLEVDTSPSSSPMLNLPYLAYAVTPFQSSTSTRRDLGLAAVSLWILSFPSRTQPSADQSLACNRSIRVRSPPSHLVFSETQSILHRQYACHNIHWRILYRLGSRSILHSEFGLILTNQNNLWRINNSNGLILAAINSLDLQQNEKRLSSKFLSQWNSTLCWTPS